MLAAGLLALLFFWATGAYNRLVRMRSAVGQAFTALDRLLIEQLAWVRAALPASARETAAGASVPVDDPATAAWMRLAAAGEQVSMALAPARERAVDRAAIAGLVLARAALQQAWDDVLTCGWFVAETLRSRESMQAEWDKLHHQQQPLVMAFDDAVHAYNAAVAQFPAALLARIAGFEPGQPLAASDGQSG